MQVDISGTTMNLLQSTIALGGFPRPVTAVGQNIRELHGRALMCCTTLEVAVAIVVIINQRFQQSRAPTG